MSFFYFGWPALGLVIGVVWLRRHADISRTRRNVTNLSADMFYQRTTAAPAVSVIVAARNEEAGIERCVGSLLEQDYPNLEVILVNDRSSDRTGEILASCSAKAPAKLRVLNVTQGRPGWFGKANAVQTGVSVARGEYLLFTDADCEQTSEHTISVAVSFAAENNIEFLSVTPLVTPGCAAEAVIQPVCTAVLVFWHPPKKVNNPDKPVAYANGAFMLIRRDAYDRIGGHERARNVLCEDMELARNAKSAGVRLYVAHNRDLYRTRMYDTFLGTWRGWTRIFQGSLQYRSRLLLAMGLLLLFSILPWVGVSASLAALMLSGSNHVWQWGTAVTSWSLAIVAQLSIVLRFYPLLGASRWRALTYIAGSLLCFGILFDALLKLSGLGSTTWRGRTYHSRYTTCGAQPASSPKPISES